MAAPSRRFLLNIGVAFEEKGEGILTPPAHGNVTLLSQVVPTISHALQVGPRGSKQRPKPLSLRYDRLS